MPSNRRSLQSQGVPWGDRLERQNRESQPAMRRKVVQKRTPLSGEMGGTQTETVTYEDRPSTTNRRNTRSAGSLRPLNPAKMGESSVGGIGALEAEFLVAITLLVMLMFANSGASYSDRIMSLMKRGTLTCILFFLLALIASSGPNAAKLSKAFGALIIVAILLTSPVNTVISDVDKLIKNDWVGSNETGNDTTQSSSDTGTQSGTTNPSPGIVQQIIDGTINGLKNIIPGMG